MVVSRAVAADTMISPIRSVMNGPDYIVDIDGIKTPASPKANPASLRGRPWLAVQWKCCSVYSRIYRNKTGTMYEGKCPKCGSPVSAKVGASGTSKRFFEAS
jgi:hypothetical protein